MRVFPLVAAEGLLHIEIYLREGGTERGGGGGGGGGGEGCLYSLLRSRYSSRASGPEICFLSFPLYGWIENTRPMYDAFKSDI